MSTVYDCQNPCLASLLDNLLNGKNNRRWAGNLTQKNHPRPGRDAAPLLLHKIVPCSQRHRDFLVDVSESTFFRKKTPGSVQRTVFVVRRKDLVADPQI